jgi:DNA-binding SARP family transcriptional activator
MLVPGWRLRGLPAAGRMPAVTVFGVDVLPAGQAVALAGPAADAAARSVLVTTLSAGSGEDPRSRPVVVITGEALVGLLGADGADLGGWRRLRVTGDVGRALEVVEARLLEASRLQLEHEKPAAGGTSPDPQSGGSSYRMLLVAATPGGALRRQLAAVARLGSGHGLSVLLLGRWDEGATMLVDVDGALRHTGGRPFGAPARMPLLDRATAMEVLLGLKQTETDHAPPVPIPTGPPSAGGQTPTATAAHAATTAVAPPAARDDPESAGRAVAKARTHPREQTPPAAPAQAATGTRHVAVVRVLGRPRIVNAETAGRPVRRASLELLVYLVVHRDGATVEQICDDMWPALRRSESSQRLHTAASTLRHLLAAAADADAEAHHAGQCLGKHAGRYRLNPQLLDVDLWRLQEAADLACDPEADPLRQVQALEQASPLYGGPLADGCNYTWLPAHRTQVAAIAAHAFYDLVDFVGAHDKTRASQLLTQAAGIDPSDEDLCREAMRACSSAGDADGIRKLLHNLTNHLDAADAAPSTATVTLFQRLMNQLGQS